MLITIFRTKQYDGVSSVAAIVLYSYNDNIGNDMFVFIYNLKIYSMKSSINKIIKHKFVLYTSVNVAVFVVFFKAILNFLNFFLSIWFVSKKKRTRQTYKIIRHYVTLYVLCVFNLTFKVKFLSKTTKSRFHLQ